MRIYIIGFYTLLISFIGPGCNKNFNCFTDNNEIIITEIPLEIFRNIKITDIFDTKIVQDSTQKITVEAKKNIADYITVSYTDSVAVISNENTCNLIGNYDKRPKLTLHIPDLDSLRVESYNNITTADTFKTDRLVLSFGAQIADCNVTLDLDKLNIDAEGETGEFIIKGKARGFNSYTRNACKIDARKFECRWAVTSSFGINDSQFNAYRLFIVNIYSSGNIQYVNSPEIRLNRLGEGNLEQIEL
ncbi:MAG: DUF2807 domain-containing protein [Bacteroidota bacterium]|nr:DUF2807 domain-containing protein [Bacteroidota bacterium]